MRIENQLHPYETVMQRTSLASESLWLNLVYVLHKAAEVSIRVLILIFFFFWWSEQVSTTVSRFIFCADSGIDEQ